MNENKSSKYEDNDIGKTSVNFYLSLTTLERLEEMIFFIKRRLPVKHRRKINKSVFFETGIKVLIDEYNLKGEESQIFKAIQKIMDD